MEESKSSGAKASSVGHFGDLGSIKFNSRRSPVFGRKGMVAASQTYACDAGMQILRKGGNAADAAVAVAAALNVTEPCSTGIGGDCFALYYDAKTKSVTALNGSGRCPSKLTLEQVRKDCLAESDTWDPFHAHTVTVPGAAAGWADTVEKWGKLSLAEVLAPAIEMAEEGFPISPVTSFFWGRRAEQLASQAHGAELLIDGRGPKPGEIFKNPTLAATFKSLAEHGKDGFYKGRIAEAIVAVLAAQGGVLSMEDLASHHSTFPEPIHVNYGGVDVYEVPPSGQGITALVALQILNQLKLKEHAYDSPERWHMLIECMRIAFADCRWYVADPDVVDVPIKELISPEYAAERVKLFDPTRASVDVEKGSPVASSNTVSFQVVDGEGNSCAFINSNYMGFGTGIVPEGCGFSLQNRGHNFSLDPAHPNRLAPNKRPYHTIIPGMALKEGELWASFSVMGGFMQPQGHVQMITNMVDYHMDPQASLDAPRFCISDGTAAGVVCVEDGCPEEVVAELRRLGHTIEVKSGFEKGVFGRGQIIMRDPTTGVLCGGSDGRADGCALGW